MEELIEAIAVAIFISLGKILPEHIVEKLISNEKLMGFVFALAYIVSFIFA